MREDRRGRLRGKPLRRSRERREDGREGRRERREGSRACHVWGVVAMARREREVRREREERWWREEGGMPVTLVKERVRREDMRAM